MVATQHQIVSQVCAAKDDPAAADTLIRQYMGYIKSETAKFLHRPPREGEDDELSIAMLAFYEAILGYERDKGPFLGYAARAIRSRLIDYYRKERRHSGAISLHAPQQADEEGSSLEHVLADPNDQLAQRQEAQAGQAEIAEFAQQLQAFGITFSDVADNCPKQERTLEACRKVLRYARAHRELLDQLVESKRLPLSALAQGSGVERKTLERHRTYLVAVLLAFTNGYEMIRGHLSQL